MSNIGQRHSALDVLRGVAALSVAWFHFTNGNPGFLPDGALKGSGSYGWMGIEVFFVISGFIIPFALARSQYHISDYGVFLLKRVVRLDPPYLISIFAVIALGYASSAAPGFQGAPFHFSLPQLLLHLGYINVLFGYPWLNPVFWTLAIELQYYLLVGLLFPVLISRIAAVRWGAVSVLAGSSFILPASQFLCHWLVLFLLGIVTFQYRAAILGVRAYVAALTFLTVAGICIYGVAIAILGLATASVIAFAHLSHTHPLVFFGSISYSLYLLHVPVGGRVVNLSLKYVHSLPGKCVVLIAALISSIMAAWLLHRFVERPAQQWSSSIGYRRGRIAPSGFAPRHA